tara:strand:+ start:708 stop:941 length:234 start_codon:yes stop_codon:yes gene_type:complete
MNFKVGESFLISFIIEGSVSLSSASFTGKTLIIQGVKCFLVKLASGKDYAFTQAQLDEFAPLNDETQVTREEHITMG